MKLITITVEKDKFILSLNLKSDPSNPSNPVVSKMLPFYGIAIFISLSYSTLIFLLVIHFYIINWCKNCNDLTYLDYADVFLLSTEGKDDLEKRMLNIAEDFVGEGINLYDNLEDLEELMQSNGFPYMDGTNFLDFIQHFRYILRKYFGGIAGHKFRHNANALKHRGLNLCKPGNGFEIYSADCINGDFGNIADPLQKFNTPWS